LAAFPAGVEVTPEDLALNGMIRSLKAPVAILGRGELPHALTVKAHRFSKSAQAKIEAAGGKIQVLPFETSRKHG
jgi:large subunit ribosomal protein L15